MYNTDPQTYLWLHEQERERVQAQRALERAVQSGQRRPGLVRAGFASFTRALRGSSLGRVDLGGTRPTAHPTGSAKA